MKILRSVCAIPTLIVLGITGTVRDRPLFVTDEPVPVQFQCYFACQLTFDNGALHVGHHPD